MTPPDDEEDIDQKLFGYHPNSGGYPDLHNHLFDLMRITSLVACSVAVFLCTGCGPPWPVKEGTQVSLTSTSPDGRRRVEIVEITGRLDRNFFLRLRDSQSGTTTNIFHSPDEGGPGTERIIWSRDSSRLLLLGRNFLVEEQGRMPDGLQLYLLYDTKSRELKCNASQQDQYRGFSRTDIEGISWTGSIEPDGARNRSQPIRVEKNRTPVAAGSDR